MRSLVRHVLKSPQRTLKAAAVTGALGLVLAVTGLLLITHTHIAERETPAQVLATTGCYKNQCGYQVDYYARDKPERATISAPPGEETPMTVAEIYYQDAHPDVARFPDTEYPGQQTNDHVFATGLILILIAAVLALHGGVRLASRQAAQRARGRTRGQHAPRR